jgi:chromosomal replication initiation ATPase DnaA
VFISDQKGMNLSLDLDFKIEFGEFFIDSSNSSALNWISSDFSFGVIFGPKGCGKTHLSYLWLSRAEKTNHKDGENGIVSIYSKPNFLFAKDFERPLDIHSIENFSAYVVNDVDRLFMNFDSSLQYEFQKNLFNFFNFCLINGKKILFNSVCHFYEWNFEFSDIESRLKSCPVVFMHSPSDSLLQLVIRRIFETYEIYISSEIVDYIFLHIDRSFESARNAVDVIVTMSCMQKRSITINFIREVFSAM